MWNGEVTSTAREGNSERDLRTRTKDFALVVVRLYSSLPSGAVAQGLGRQVLRSGTCVGAHYREARRARSSAEFISKIEAGLQEVEETMYWFELLDETGVANKERLRQAVEEADIIAAMMTASVRTAKRKRQPGPASARGGE
jgi:four helix bundle protein